MIAIVPPARAVWFDLDPPAETLLPAADDFVSPSSKGFLWIDLELPAPEALRALAAAGVLPPDLVADDDPAGRVSWNPAPGHLHLSLAGARLSGDSLELDRRHVLVADGAVVSLHRGLPAYFDEVRDRYRDGFARFARSHGFLLYEMAGHLADGLQWAVRGLGDRIDELRVSAARPRAAGATALSCSPRCCVMRRILARTRDLLVELSSRRSPFVPETTQPFLHDMADRLDGLMADLAFSRDVLDEALRLTGALGARAGSAWTAGRRPTVAPVSIASLGGLRGAPRGCGRHGRMSWAATAARELLAALLAARRPVGSGPAARVALARSAARPGNPRARRGGRLAARGPRRGADRLRGLGAPAGPRSSWPGRLVGRGRAARVADGALEPERPRRAAGQGPRGLRAAVLSRVAPRRVGSPGARGLRPGALGRSDAPGRGAPGRGPGRRGGAPISSCWSRRDPESEAAHRGLMRCHAEAGPIGPWPCDSSTPAGPCCARPRAWSPSPETQALYLELLARR